MQLRRGGVQRRGPHPHQRLHLLQAAGPRGGRAAHPLLQPQVRVRGALQHRHSPPDKHSQDHAGESYQGQHNSIIPIINIHSLTIYSY